MYKTVCGWLFAIIVIVIFSCKTKLEPIETATRRAGVCLSFDDANIDNWHKYLPLLDSFQVKATFYISGYTKLSAAQKLKLHAIKSYGHEIAYHTVNHPDLLKESQKQKFNKVIEKEITPGITKMKQDGYSINNFAYPYGAHSSATDAELLKIFKTVRCLNGTSDKNKSIVNYKGNKVTYAIGLDESSKHSLPTLLNLLEKASNNNMVLVAVIHNIETPNTKLQMPLEKLKTFLAKAKALDLKYYTTNEIAQ